MNKNKTTTSSDSENEESIRKDKAIFESVERMMHIDKIYRDAGITLDKMAKNMGIHRNTLSRVVNNCSGRNFSRYVNAFRIIEAIELLSRRAKKKIKMHAVWRSVGFASRTPFYNALKEISGLTIIEIRSGKKPEFPISPIVQG